MLSWNWFSDSIFKDRFSFRHQNFNSRCFLESLTKDVWWILHSDIQKGNIPLIVRMQKGSTHTYSAFPGEDTTSYRGTPFQAAMHNCNYSVISANETSFVKDIGRAEESLLAVKIYHQLRSEGLDTCGLDIHSQADHGLILDKYASSDHAFYATKELVGEIRSHMTLMLKACENLVDAANDTCDLALMASARAAVLVFVQCSLGYFLFNPFSRRYCESFAAVKAVMKNDKQAFKTALNVHRTPAGKILF